MSVGSGRTLVVAWVVLVAAGTLLAIAARGAGPLPGDLALTRSLQKLLPQGGVAGSVLTYAGDLVWFLPPAALVVTLLARWWSAALFVLLAGFTGWLVGDALKLILARPRPSAELVAVYDPSGGYGFPSGTALFAVVVLGVIWYLIRRAKPPRAIVVAALGVALLVVLASGLSRVYVGEHWVTDVLGGWLFGGAWLLILILGYRWWIHRRSDP